MIQTEYLRQVPVKSWLPVPFDDGSFVDIDGSFTRHRKEETTGYKTQRAWYDVTHPLCKPEQLSMDLKMFKAELEQGQEVEGFKWIDLPVGEPC